MTIAAEDTHEITLCVSPRAKVLHGPMTSTVLKLLSSCDNERIQDLNNISFTLCMKMEWGRAHMLKLGLG